MKLHGSRFFNKDLGFAIQYTLLVWRLGLCKLVEDVWFIALIYEFIERYSHHDHCALQQSLSIPNHWSKTSFHKSLKTMKTRQSFWFVPNQVKLSIAKVVIGESNKIICSTKELGLKYAAKIGMNYDKRPSSTISKSPIERLTGMFSFNATRMTSCGARHQRHITSRFVLFKKTYTMAIEVSEALVPKLDNFRGYNGTKRKLQVLDQMIV